MDHLAITWRKLGNGETVVTLFADGVPVQSSQPHNLEIRGDWTGQAVVIPGSQGELSVAAVRVSRRPIYADDFTPGPLEQDADTLLLAVGDGEGLAVRRPASP